MSFFDMNLRTRASLHPDGEPSEFVVEHEGSITTWDEETGLDQTVGRVKAMRVHAGLAAADGESLFEVCDCHSDELHRLHSLLYEPKGYTFREPLIRRFEAVGWDLLVLDYVILAPKWRRLKLGLLAVRKLVDLLGGGCGLAVSHIAPLNRSAHKQLRVPEKWLPRNRSKDAQREARVRLRRYFRRMGFERIGRTEVYALTLNIVTPSARELLGGKTS